MYSLCQTVVINQEGTISERLCTGTVLLCCIFMCLFYVPIPILHSARKLHQYFTMFARPVRVVMIEMDNTHTHTLLLYKWKTGEHVLTQSTVKVRKRTTT